MESYFRKVFPGTDEWLKEPLILHISFIAEMITDVCIRYITQHPNSEGETWEQPGGQGWRQHVETERKESFPAEVIGSTGWTACTLADGRCQVCFFAGFCLLDTGWILWPLVLASRWSADQFNWARSGLTFSFTICWWQKDCWDSASGRSLSSPGGLILLACAFVCPPSLFSSFLPPFL